MTPDFAPVLAVWVLGLVQTIGLVQSLDFDRGLVRDHGHGRVLFPDPGLGLVCHPDFWVLGSHQRQAWFFQQFVWSAFLLLL